MKYEILFEKGRYALILRGEKMCEYAVVKDLDNTNREWGYTVSYCGFGPLWGNSQAEALSECLDTFRYSTEKDYISRNRLIELSTQFKDALIEVEANTASEVFKECELSDHEREFFGIDEEIEIDDYDGYDDMEFTCDDCPPEDCTGHCMSCMYR